MAAAWSQIALRESDVVAVRALVAQRGAELGAARSRLMRSQTLSQEGAASRQELDDDRARVHSAEAVLTAARAQVAAAQAGARRKLALMPASAPCRPRSAASMPTSPTAT